MINAKRLVALVRELDNGTSEEIEVAELIKAVVSSIEEDAPEYPPPWAEFLRAHVRLRYELPLKPPEPWKPTWHIEGIGSKKATIALQVFLDWLYFEKAEPWLGVCHYERCQRLYIKSRRKQKWCSESHRVMQWQLGKRRESSDGLAIRILGTETAWREARPPIAVNKPSLSSSETAGGNSPCP